MKNKYLFILCLLCCYVMMNKAVGQSQNGKVGINTLTPTEALDVDGKIRIRSGAQKGFLLQSDSLGAATWVNPVHLTPTVSAAICITDFGAVGDGKTDNTLNIQKAIDSAAFAGGKICVPSGTFKITGSLRIPAGVILEGFGTGSNPLATPSNGSVIKYTGNDQAIIISGSDAGLRDLVIYDENNAGAAGAITISASGKLVESCMIRNVLISGFTDGTALKLEALNSGGIAYCSFEDVRIRHAKTGINIVQDVGSFVNSNSFYHGAVSGGGFDYCIRIQGGNNNIFEGIVLEPYSSVKGHLVIEKGSIAAHEIRIEGSQQPVDVPLINFFPATAGSTVDGLYGGGLIINDGDNFVNMRSGKAIGIEHPGVNIFLNAGFKGFVSGTLPGWIITGAGNNTISQPEILPEHFVMKLTVPAGALSTLKPDQKSLPVILNDPMYGLCNFGFYVKCDKPGVAFTTFNSPAGMASSAPHPGDNKWHFIGMSAIVNPAQPAAPMLRLDAGRTSGDATVFITAPSFCFGNNTPYAGASAITTNGGIINGTLSTSMVTVTSASLLSLPKAGNVFIVEGINAITKINQPATDRFPKGTVITLLFNEPGVSILKNGYLILKKNFLSTANSSLTLLSLGDGTWRELQRNL
jgi:hypothetical protein